MIPVNTAKSYLILSMCLLFLIHYFFESEPLGYVVAVIAIIAFFSSLAQAHRLPRIFGSAMLASGLILEWTKGTPVQGMMDGMTINLPLITLIILVPLLSIPLKLGGYFQAVDAALFSLRHRPGRLFAGITGLLFFLGPILNLGSLRVMDDLLKRLKLPPAMLAKAYSIGFSTTILWSPYYASVALVLFYLKVPVKDYVAYGIGLAAFFVMIGNILFQFWLRKHPFAEERAEAQPLGGNRGKLLRMGWIVAGLMLATFILEHFTHWSMLVIVSLLAVFYPVVWAAANRVWRPLGKQWIEFRDRSVPAMNNEIVLFISAGFLGLSLQNTGVGDGVRRIMVALADQSFFLFGLMVLATIVVISMVGIHPIVIVTALITQMNAQEMGTTNPVLAMLIMLSWSVSAVLSPFNPMNLLVSKFAGMSGIEAGYRANGLFVSLAAVIGLAVITVIR